MPSPHVGIFMYNQVVVWCNYHLKKNNDCVHDEKYMLMTVILLRSTFYANALEMPQSVTKPLTYWCLIAFNLIIGYFLSLWTWCHLQMETFSALLAICVGNSPATGEFPTERPVTQSFDVFFDLYLNKRLSLVIWDTTALTMASLWWKQGIHGTLTAEES